MSTTELAAALEERDNPIPATGITRIEKGQRRVDADDLVALADSLNVAPLTLLLPPTAGGELVDLTPNRQVTARIAWQWARGERTAVDWEPGGLLPAAGSGADPVGDTEVFKKEQEFARKQAEYKALAEPVERRRAADHSAVRLARNLEDVLADLVTPEAGVDRAVLAARLRMARRRHAQLGFELDAIEERLPPVHPGVAAERSEYQAQMEDEFVRLARSQAEARADIRYGTRPPADQPEG